MISNIDVNCCGCSSCVQSCSKQCISFDEDNHGFRYPMVDTSNCIDCHLCEKVCPMLNRKESVEPKRVCAAVNLDTDIRSKSSSGGVFTMLTESVLKDGGVVFGARFNENWEVVHDFVERPELLVPFRGAKYSQSIVGDTYKQAREFLKVGRKVLFSGTGCQIAGLKLFLRKEYDNLLTVEIACHGVPSPLVWREYVNKVTGRKKLSNIVFRDKRNGWNGYGLSFVGADGDEIKYERAFTNDFMQGFLNDLCVRPSCSNCPAKAGASGADILIGDFWGIDGMHPEMHDNKGCSLVICYTEKGQKIVESLDMKTLDTTYEEAYRYNPCIIRSTHESRYAPIFWHNFRKYSVDALPMTLKLLRSGRLKRIFTVACFKIFH